MTTVPPAPNILDPALIADPYSGFNQIRDETPLVVGVGADGAPAWYVTRYDDVQAVLNDSRFVNNPESAPGLSATSSRDRMLAELGIPSELYPYISKSILDLDGDDHGRLRRFVSRAFTARRVGGLRGHVQDIATELLGNLGPTADLISEFAYPLPITVICELVGVPVEDRGLWRTAGSALTSIVSGSKGEAARSLVEYTHALVDRRRVAPADDLVSELLAIRDDGDRLSDVELVTMVLSLATAGHETTAHLIGNGVLALLDHPEQLVLQEQ